MNKKGGEWMATKPKRIRKEEVEEHPMIIKDNQGNIVAEYDRDMIETIKATVAKNATDSEMMMFLNLASRYDLDPFKKEIWFLKYKGNDPQIFTSRDGFLKIAKRDDEFKQIQSQAVYENDEFEIGQEFIDGQFQITSFKHSFGAKERGKLLGAYCVIEYHTNKPTVIYVSYDEYKQATPTWKKNGSSMIRKVAEKEACRLSAGISGLHIPEEMPMYYQNRSKQILSDDDSLDRIEAEASRQMKKNKEVIDIEIEESE